MDLNIIEARVQKELITTLSNIHNSKAEVSQTALKTSDCCDNAEQVQQQYQLKSTITRLTARANALKLTKVKLTNDEFGYCQECGDDIELGRIHFDITCTHCITCQTKKEMSQHLYAG